MIGQRCPRCKTKLIYAQTISLCLCALSCHEKCFLESYSEKHEIDENIQLKCQTCSQMIQFVYYYDKQLNCRKDPSGVALYTLSALLIIIMTLIIREGIHRLVISDTTAYIILIGIIVGYVFSLIFSNQSKILVFQKTRCISTRVNKKKLKSRLSMKVEATKQD